jgi:hypothetical protein
MCCAPLSVLPPAMAHWHYVDQWSTLSPFERSRRHPLPLSHGTAATPPPPRNRDAYSLLALLVSRPHWGVAPTFSTRVVSRTSLLLMRRTLSRLCDVTRLVSASRAG